MTDAQHIRGVYEYRATLHDIVYHRALFLAVLQTVVISYAGNVCIHPIKAFIMLRPFDYRPPLLVIYNKATG